MMDNYQQEEVGVEASGRQETVQGDTAAVRINLPEVTKKSLPDPYTEGLMVRPRPRSRKKMNVPGCGSFRFEMQMENDAEVRSFAGSSSAIETVTMKIKEHNEDKDLNLLNEVYRSITGGSILERGIDEFKIYKQKTPQGSTLLHTATAYGNDEWVRSVLENAPELLIAENSNGDMALHVAARVGHTSILKDLLRAHLLSCPECIVEDLDTRNKQGNNFIHEALLNGHKVVVMNILSSGDNMLLPAGVHKEMVELTALFAKNEQDESILYIAIEAGYKEVVQQVLSKLSNPALLGNFSEKYPEFEEAIRTRVLDAPTGKSPLLAAIMKRDREILDLILTKIPAWIHLRDKKGRIALHYAASLGYLDGVQYLLGKCASCATERDNDGLFPLHCASSGGHVEVVEVLINEQYCVDPREILDRWGRNFLHIAVESGKLNVVRHILKAADNELLINQQDIFGYTPLHLASWKCHPKIVHALTWDKRVNLTLVNILNQTALDICMHWPPSNHFFRQRLTWAALKSAGVRHADPPPFTSQVAVQTGAPYADPFKEKLNTLMLVSTLIVTVTFAAGLTLPGGIKSSDPGQGMALMLHRMLFKLFIICITISMYGAISATIILTWAQLGDSKVALFALKVAKYCLGVTLATLSLAFLAGVHLVISDLSWLATTALVMSVIFILMLLVLYILLWLPSTSTCPIARYLFYYPFLMLARIVD